MLKKRPKIGILTGGGDPLKWFKRKIGIKPFAILTKTISYFSQIETNCRYYLQNL